MYVKLEEIVPPLYVWKCTRLGFPRLYFLGRKFAHVCAYTHTHTLRLSFIINTETWTCTTFTYISTSI